jgi:hypothetical protein
MKYRRKHQTMPKKAPWTKWAASTKKGTFALAHLLQAWFEFGVLEAVLFLLLERLVRPTRHCSDFANLHMR